MTLEWVLVLVVGCLVLAGLGVGCLIGRGAERRRRGGLLELDGLRPVSRPTSARKPPQMVVEVASERMLGRCGHLIRPGFQYVHRLADGTAWCSPMCESAWSEPRSFVPFAGGNGDAA